MDTTTATYGRVSPWNKGKPLGQKPPLKLKEIWAIRIRLQLDHRARELALFNLAIDSKLRRCDLVGLRVHDELESLKGSKCLLQSSHPLAGCPNERQCSLTVKSASLGARTHQSIAGSMQPLRGINVDAPCATICETCCSHCYCFGGCVVAVSDRHIGNTRAAVRINP